MPQITSKVQYSGHLRTYATHLKSGESITTDAPLDNNGQGAYFSPTDLVATSLASCMLTLMGIHAEKHTIILGNVDVEVTKLMGSKPRRIVGIVIDMKIVDRGFSDEDKRVLEQAALNCPVAKSLHPDIDQDVTFRYLSSEAYA